MNYQECLSYLRDLGHELRGVHFSLEAITAILARLGDPHRQYPTVIVAGTNGKGSTSAILASILGAAGYRTGLYTSPHLIRVNERILVGGAEISDADFAAAFSEVRQAVDGLLAAGALASRPSFFEFLTAAAFLHFARARVDFAVLEVGMGGRLDATNVTEPRLAVITNVDLDHQEYLGNTRAAIAREKAGVIQPGRPVVAGRTEAEAIEVIRERCAELGSPLIETSSRGLIQNLRSRQGRYEFDFVLDGDFFPALVSPLLGRFQVENAATAITAVCELRRQGFAISPAAVREGVRRASWPGRLEVAAEHPLVLLDGAHNPAGAREVAAFVREHLATRTLRLVYASMRDKAIGEISGILFPLAAEIYLTQPNQSRAATPEEMLAAARVDSGRAYSEIDPVKALQRAVDASSAEDVVLAAGSLFLVGEIKRALRQGELTFRGQHEPAAARA